MKFYDDDDIWDEFQWESHLSEIEEQSEQIRGFLESTLNEKHEPRWMRLMDECSSELDLMNTFIEEELLIEDSYFPDDEDWEEDDEEFDDPMFDMLEIDEEWEEIMDQDESDEDDLENMDLFSEDLDDELDDWDLEGEEWKSLTEDFALSDYGSIEKIEVYVTARDFGAEIFRLLEHKKDLLNKDHIQEFVSDVVQISAKLAGGYAFGFEMDVLGANIAYSKRALNFANKALVDLKGLKKRKVFSTSDYYRLHATLFELRNDIGIYVQDIRQRFYEGL